MCQYTGAVNFTALRELSSIDIVYDTIEEPGDDEIDYPHRFLYTWANDFGENYETLYPNITFRHSYINTGVTCEDMSRLTITLECEKVDQFTPFHTVNGAYGYLFGSDGGI